MVNVCCVDLCSDKDEQDDSEDGQDDRTSRCGTFDDDEESNLEGTLVNLKKQIQLEAAKGNHRSKHNGDTFDEIEAQIRRKTDSRQSPRG